MLLNISGYKFSYANNAKLKQAKPSFRGTPLKKDTVTFTSSFKGNPKFFKGAFGIQCADSTPLQKLSENRYKNLKGFSTPPNNTCCAYLSGDINTPLSTSGVHNCTALAVSNSKQHFIYHAAPNTPEKDFKKIINMFMGKDFNQAYIILGHLEQTKVSATNMFKALRKINPKAQIEFKHYASANPEIVSHMNKIYEIPTSGKYAQASFEVVENLTYGLFD